MGEPILPYESQWSSLKLIYLDNTIYEGSISSMFTFEHKSSFILMQYYIGVSEQSLWIWLID